MKKLLSLLAFMLISLSYAYAGDALYKTLTFPNGNNASIGSYTNNWTATCEGMTWHLRNFNNNNNKWAFVKCGRKNNPSVGEIFTESVSEKISKVVVKLDNSMTKSEYVNATYLEIANDTLFSNPVKVAVGMNNSEVTYSVAEPKANMCYRIIYDCKSATGNGIVVVTSVELYKVDNSTLSEPAFTPVGGTYYEPIQVKLSSADGADIYYSFDNSNFTKYTAAISLAAGDVKTIYAYATNGTLKSGVKMVDYKIAKSYASFDELLKETPTSDGWPVIVPFKDEEIASFYGGTDYRNGVYLTRQANGKNFELYCRDAPMTWNVGDKLSGTAKGIYQNYNGQWEISLISWDGISPASPTGVIAPEIAFNESSKTVTITDPSGSNNTIFYTIDGSEPDDSKNLYEAPFTIEKTTVVKAVCYNDLDEKSPVATKSCEIAGEALKTCADLIANCKTTEGINVAFEFTDLIVTAANGQYVFVKDATGPFLLYKSSSYKRGDKLSGKVQGKLYIYNGVYELSVNDWNSVTVASSGNEVIPATVKVADVKSENQNKYVSIKGLKYVNSDNDYYYFTDGKDTLTVFDKFKKMALISLSASNIYDFNCVITMYKTNPQVYVFDAADVTVTSTKTDAETMINNAEHTSLKVALTSKTTEVNFSTKSDGQQTWTSGNEAVATVANGKITLVGTGATTITFATEETATYQAGKAVLDLFVVSGAKGGETDPYDVGDVQAEYASTAADTINNVWVKGYIVGFANGSLSKAVFGTEEAIESNILIAKTPGETNVNNCIPVALETKPATTKAVRDTLNLAKHPENLGKEIMIHGGIMKYFSTTGMKSLDQVKFVGAGLKGDANEDGQVDVADITAIASHILGDTPTSFNMDNADVNGDGNIDVADITSTAVIILN